MAEIMDTHKNKIMKWYNIYGILVALIFYLIFMRPSGYIDREVIKYDTVYTYVEKHIIDTVPKLVYIDRIRTDTVKFYTVDSVIVEVPIPIEQKHYTNNIDTVGTYNAWVSGFNPQLDSISFNLKYPTTTIYIDRTKFKKSRFNHGIQVGVGYGVINNKPDVYVGYGVHYNF